MRRQQTSPGRQYNPPYIQIKEDIIIINIEAKIEEKEINNIVKNEELLTKPNKIIEIVEDE